MSEETKPLNIFQRIHAVMTELNSVSKVKQVKHGDKFKYIGHDDVTEALQPLFVKHGIVQRVSLVGLDRDASQMVKVALAIHWVNIDNPEDMMGVSAYGESAATIGVREGAPRGDDLQIGKAVSYAVKVAQLKNFVLFGDTTPDNETEQQPAQARQPAAQPAPKGEPVPDVEIEALIGSYDAVTTRAGLNAVRDEVFRLQPRMTQAQEDKLAPFDRAADERTLK